MGQEEDKSKLRRSESRRARDGSVANMESQSKLTREDSNPKDQALGIRREQSMSKKKKDPNSRRGSSIERQDSHSKKEKKNRKLSISNDPASRRGSALPGGGNARRLSTVYVKELQKISDNQIINLNAIQDELHPYRMIKFSSDLMVRLRNPLDDIETLVVPISSKTFVELVQDIYSIALNLRYYRQNEVLTWAKDEEFIDDILCAFSGEMGDFDPVSLLSRILDSLAAGTTWKILYKAIYDIYTLIPDDSEYKIKQLFQDSGPQILDQLLILVSNWVWLLRQSHISLCTQISTWFNTHSAEDWKESRIPVVYGAFSEGNDINGLFGQILHGTATLDLVKMNLLCTKIANSLEKYPNQKEFMHLEVFRHFVEFRSKVLVMVKLLQLCRLLQADKEIIFNAIESFDDKSKKATDEMDDSQTKKTISSEKVCVFSKVFKTKTDFLNSLYELKRATDSTSFASVYPRVLNSQLEPSFRVFEDSLATSIKGTKKYDCPDILPKTVQERRKIETTVSKLRAKLAPEDSDQSNYDNFLGAGIAIQIDEAPPTVPMISIIDTDPDVFPKSEEEPEILQTIAEDDALTKKSQNYHLNIRPTHDDVELDEVLIMPESVNKDRFTLHWEDKDTLSALFGHNFGNVNFNDVKRILKVIGCKIVSEDGIGLIAIHPRSKVPISIFSPFPDLQYKLYALDRIKNALQDFLGVYLENFDLK